VRQPDKKEAIAKILMEDLLVLAVESAIDGKNLLVTLAATPEQVGKLAQAAGKGSLRVTLRPPGKEK